MSLADKLRGARIQKLHGRFVAASAKYRLSHVAARSDDPGYWKLLCPPTFPEHSENGFEGELFGWAPEDYWSPKSAHEALWWRTVRASTIHRLRIHGLPDNTHRISIDGAQWIGLFVCDGYSERGPIVGPWNDPIDYGLPLYTDLTDEAMADLGRYSQSAAAARWIELLYELLPAESEEIDKVVLTGLPWNVFSASAREFELLLNRSGPQTELALTDSQQEVYDYLRAEGPKTGKEIAKAVGVNQSTLTRHILPDLRRDFGLKNRRGRGYYFEAE